MSEKNFGARGVPLLTGSQWLIAGVALGASWFLWPDVRKPQADSGVNRRSDADDDPVAASLDNLRTLEAIARTGPEGLQDLVDALANPDFRLRRNTLLALRSMGPDAAQTLVAIRERLTDEDAQVRAMAIDAYWHIRRNPDDVAAVAAPLLGDREANVREAAAEVLESIGPMAIGAVVEMLRSGAPAGRIPALIVLRRIGWDASQPHIDTTVRDLARDPDIRVEALRTLAAWGHPTPREIRELLQVTDAVDGAGRDSRTEPGPRETALRAIIRQAPAAENVNDVVDLLVESRPGGEQWNLALASLRTMPPAARAAAPRLLQIMNEYRDFRRIDVGWVFLAIGGDPQEIVRVTVPLFLDKDTDLCFHAGRLCASASPDEARRQVSRLIPLLVPEKLANGLSALQAVWGLAPEAQEAIPALSRLLECGLPHVARSAAKALGDIGPEAAVAAPVLLAQLTRGLDAHDYYARSAFCEAIGKLGPIARSAVPALLAELREAPLSRPPVGDLNRAGQRPVYQSLTALIRIGDADPAGISQVRRHLENKDDHVQLSALRALARLTPESPELLLCHSKWLRDNPASQYRVGVVLAISQLPANRHHAVSLLIDLLAHSDPEIRKAAAWSLGKIGPDARAALPALSELLKDWRDSLYSFHNRRSPRLPPLADNPRIQLEKGRWSDRQDPFLSEMNDLQYSRKSVTDVVREAITEIEAGFNE